jgi:ribosome biogenesis GTPase
MNKGFITCLNSGDFTLYDEEKKAFFVGKPQKKLRFQGKDCKVGDEVIYELENSFANIKEILPRMNDFIRPAICNLDQVFLVFSVKEPILNLNLLDRFLAEMEYSGVPVILVFTKMDLLSTEEQKDISKIISYYASLGYAIRKTSSKDHILDSLEKDIPEKRSVITGQSGVGKTSLLNELDQEIAKKTQEISKALNRGKHTTRLVEYLPIRNGWIADTPGFGNLQLEEMDEQSLAQSFTEFFKISPQCKYHGCLHLDEPGCAVRMALKDGNILPSRYENYLQIHKEIKERKKRW